MSLRLTAATVQWQCPCLLKVGHRLIGSQRSGLWGEDAGHVLGARHLDTACFPYASSPGPACHVHLCFLSSFSRAEGCITCKTSSCVLWMSCSHVQARSLAARQLAKKVVSCVVNLACLGLKPTFGACVSSHFACWSDICAHVCYVCCSPGNRTWRLMETVCFVERGCLQSMQP